MQEKGNRLRILGASKLFSEIIAAALSVQGWYVLDSPHACSKSVQEPEILLLLCPLEPEEIIRRIRRARAEYPCGKVILMDVDAPETTVIQLIREGARAFISSGHGIKELISILEMVRDNQTTCSGWITELVLGTIHQLSREHHAFSETLLTAREQEILRLIQSGLRNKEIATRLGIATSTVKNHVHHLLRKLHVRSRHKAAWTQIQSFPDVSLLREHRNGATGWSRGWAMTAENKQGQVVSPTLDCAITLSHGIRKREEDAELD